jgi:transcriptional regulator GlxA family with amidase domain
MLTELLLEGSDSNEDNDTETLNDHIRRALDYVDDNYTGSISLKEMAGFACLSEYHFSRLFKKITGYSPYEYIIKYRVNKAKNLLKNTDKTVEEIAEAVGFGSNSNFVRTFREVEGLTPLKYRKYWN